MLRSNLLQKVEGQSIILWPRLDWVSQVKIEYSGSRFWVLGLFSQCINDSKLTQEPFKDPNYLAYFRRSWINARFWQINPHTVLEKLPPNTAWHIGDIFSDHQHWYLLISIGINNANWSVLMGIDLGSPVIIEITCLHLYIQSPAKATAANIGINTRKTQLILPPQLLGNT